MENASKALIIAGAILLSILIIGLGMFIYQRAAGAMDTTAIDSAKVQAYNAPFEQYFGTRKSGADVKSLIDAVNTHNISTTADTSLAITITPSNITGATAGNTSAILTTLKSKVLSGKTFTVVAGNTEAGASAYDTTTGYLTNIFIKQN